MIRKLLLLVGTFALLMAAFFVYQSFTRQSERSALSEGRTRTRTAASRPTGMDTGGGEEAYWPQRDARTGRIKNVYRAKTWAKLQGPNYRLTEPVVEIYMNDGQRIMIRGDEATVQAEEVAKGSINPRRGVLKGHVRLLMDRTPRIEMELHPLDDRADDANLMRVFLDEVNFNNDLLSIDSEGPFTIFSPEADVVGRGLSISLHESPRELRKLEVHQGEQLTLKNVPEETMNLSPGGTGVQVTTSARPARPATAPSMVPSLPATAPAIAAEQGAKASAAQSKPASGGKKGKPAATQPAANVYVVELVDRQGLINVDQGEKKLHGAESITLTIDWGKGGLGGQRDKNAASAPAVASAAPAGGKDKASAGAKAPTTTAASAPASQPGRRRGEPMVVTWNGPLTIRPLGYFPLTEKTRLGVREIKGQGANMMLTDGKVTSTCKEFAFDNHEKKGYLQGSKETPAHVTFSGSGELFCPRVELDNTTGLANMVGEGKILVTGKADSLGIAMDGLKSPAAAPASAPASVPANAVAAGEVDESMLSRISWTDSGEVSFSQGKVGTAGGGSRTVTYFNDLLFRGKVHAVQGKTADGKGGDYIDCDNFQVALGHSSTLRNYVTQFTGSGNVAGRQEGRDIKADRLIVDFEEVIDPNDPTRGRVKSRPGHLLAEGKVEVSEQPKPGRDALLAKGDKIQADLIKRSARIFGKPAQVAQGANRIVGPEIWMDEATEKAMVNGAGALDFKTDKNFNGGKLATPRLVNVVWSEHMRFEGKLDTAQFFGDVFLKSGQEEMKCEAMNLMFEPAPAKPAKPARSSASKPGATVAAVASRPAIPAASAPVAATASTSPEWMSMLTSNGAKSIVAPAASPSPAVPPAGPTAELAPSGQGELLVSMVGDGSAASQPAKEKDRRMGLGVENFSNRRIAILHLDKKVKVNTTRYDEQNNLIQRVQMRGEHLMYDARTDQVNVFGYGTFLAEDYRPPQAVKDANSANENISHPNQTAFEWHTLMTFSMGSKEAAGPRESTVTMEGKVMMNHHSGKYVIQPQGVKLPAWGDLADGRITKLSCDKMIAKFGPAKQSAPRPASQPDSQPGSPALAGQPASDPTSKPATDWLTGPQVGNLEQFVALRDVNMEDGVRQKRQILAQRLVYDHTVDGKLVDVMQIFGYLENRAPSDARLISEDLDLGKSETVQSPKITWYRRNEQRPFDRIETDRMGGGGTP